MGTPLGPKHLPYTYMDPLGKSFPRPGDLASKLLRSGLSGAACGELSGALARFSEDPSGLGFIGFRV